MLIFVSQEFWLTFLSSHSRPSDEGSVSLDSQDGEQRPAEVIAQLESLLSATAEELEQQRRLNQALIKRKVLSEMLY